MKRERQNGSWRLGAGLLGAGLLEMGLLGALLTGCHSERRAPAELVLSVGDVQAIHADVSVEGRTLAGSGRLADGDTLRTGPAGRARVRLDDGTLVAVDVATTLTVHGRRLELLAGRAFVQAGSAGQTEIALGSAATTLSSSAASFERSERETRVYCASGELTLRHASGQTRVMSGETATLGAGLPSVVPEKAFDDWTRGLAVPWGSALGERSAIPEARAGAGLDGAGEPLVIRSQAVDVELRGEVAVTRTRTRYFNGSSSADRVRVRLALPPGALLERVQRHGADTRSAELAISMGQGGEPTSGLWWAGGGWLAGDLGSIAPGESLDLELEYVEWLSARAGRTEYRFPMAGSGDALIGELSLDVRAPGAPGSLVSASAGASRDGDGLRRRVADVRPTGDWVVELEPAWATPGEARAYVASAEPGEDAFVMVRTELPERALPGVTLALVLDTSLSIGQAALETERAVLDAVLGGLGPRDAILVLAADQTSEALGPASPEPVTPELRAQIQSALARVRAGGASDLGAALERAADILDAPSRGDQAGLGMVVYVGDGQATLGETDARSIRERLERRTSGMPRLAAIAVGANADRWGLARLVAGAGSLYDVNDRSDAARAGAALLAEALEPTLRDVRIDLGPNIDRVYPRDARALPSGSTVSVLGRLRGALPARIGFGYRDGSRWVSEQRPLLKRALPAGADIEQRWAAARVEELSLRDEDVQSAIALALKSKLLTPWTSWFFDPELTGRSAPLHERVLELTPVTDTAFARRIEPLGLSGSTLIEPPDRGAPVSLAAAAERAVRSVLERATTQLRACRDARASLRPDTGRGLVIELEVDGGGHASRVRIEQLGSPSRDRVLERCAAAVVQSLPYLAMGVATKVRHGLELPAGRGATRTRCSEAAGVSLPVRRMIWRARGSLDVRGYLQAARACELPRWADRRAFLELVLDAVPNAWDQLELARGLDASGESDAAGFVRRETLRRVRDFDQLRWLSRELVRDEPNIDAALDDAYTHAATDAARLAVLRRFLLLAPHDARARRRLLRLLEASSDRPALLAEIEALRAEPFIDPSLLAQAASALRRAGLDAEGLRAFGELLERAPADPWTLAYTGDRLRAEGLFDAASAAYDSLARALPEDAAVLLRSALGRAQRRRAARRAVLDHAGRAAGHGARRRRCRDPGRARAPARGGRAARRARDRARAVAASR